MNMRFGTWNVKNAQRTGSLMTFAIEISKDKLDSVGVQEVKWERGGTKPACEYTFFYEREMRIMKWLQVLFTRNRMIPAVKRVVFVSDRMSYTILRGRWSTPWLSMFMSQ
jgi:hypothetical protein